MAKRVAIILAAGESNRMITRLPKVLHEICGLPLIEYVLSAFRQVDVEKMYVVVGFGKEQVIERYKDCDDIVFVEQTEQKGTGHAVMCCKQYLEDFDGEVLVHHGDVPLVTAETLRSIINKHEQEKAAITLGTAILDDPSGYGRIIRDLYGNIQSIVEDVDCTGQQRKINEMNPAYYCFNSRVLLESLEKITPDNAKHEYYLPDAVRVAMASGQKVIAIAAVSREEALGVNNRAQLSEASKIMQQRIQRKLLDSGVTVVDPPNTWIDIRAKIGSDTIIEPFTYIHGEVKIGRNCRIGPFAYLRDGTVLSDDVVLGVFSEVKNSTFASGVRARHHSFIGDAELGKNVNIGAGSITANYDGHKVNKTKIGDDCYIGSGAILVAPIELKNGSHIDAGTVVTQDSVDRIGPKG